jgi:hypothetical protein
MYFSHLKKGDVAQLARALDWQSRGRRFEPDLLHIENQPLTLYVGGFFIYILRLNIDISWQLFGLYFIGDRVQPSFSLDPEILKAEGQAFSEDKRHYVHRIRRLTKLVVATCERIEHSPVQSKDFLQLLKKEL